MDKAGSAIVFFHEEYSHMPKDIPVATTFVEVVSLDRLRPMDASVPLNAFLEKTVCGVDVDGTIHRCLVLTVAKDTPLEKQVLFVHGEKKAIQDRAVVWMDGLGLRLDLLVNAAINVVVPTPPRPSKQQTGTPKVVASSTGGEARPVNSGTITPSSSSVAVVGQARPATSVRTVVAVPSTSTVAVASPAVTGTVASGGTKPLARSTTSVSYGRVSRLDGKRSASVAMDYGDSDSEASYYSAQKLVGPRHRKKRPDSRSGAKRVANVASAFAQLLPGEGSGEGSGGQTAWQLAQSAAGTNSLQVAVSVVLRQLFSTDELHNGYYTQNALVYIRNKPEAATAKLLDQEKFQLAKEAVSMWRHAKGQEEMFTDDQFKHYCRLVRQDVRNHAAITSLAPAQA